MKQLIILKENPSSIKNAIDIFKNIKKINIDYEQENFIIFYLNTKNKIIDSEILFKGGLDACLICPKTIFRNALKQNSAKIIIAHNHPSNDLNPSYEDREVLEQLSKAGDIIDLKVLDFITFNKKEFYSITDGDKK